ncbi:MAG TPA: TonB-dependent receptor, partial [Nitrospirales bacterium]|nr:TonB-dependent receptor [Nitrospirales bacterium]
FLVEVVDEQATIWVFEGRVYASNDRGNLTLVSGQTAVSQAGQAPALVTVVKPRDAVQWALYYPPLIDYRPVDVSGSDATIIRNAIERYRQQDVSGALKQMEAIAAARRDVQFYLLRAGFLLSVGRVEQAQTDLAEAGRLEPGNGRVLALQSLIAVVQNDKETALRLARQARERAPDASMTWIALSYAYQAAFDIEKARESVEQAVKVEPENALAWARLSELWLSEGYLYRALDAAEEAATRNPDLARTQSVLGFAYLVQIKLEKAKAAFIRAIDRDQADPLPHLGLGLAMIRESDLAEGRREIEVAVSLDPNNSLLRSYLGKSYFEERRNPLDGIQFDLAKQLDPLDPTPWFYDAIRKQSINRPVEALHDFREAIERNDNQAVFRSKLFLDQDQAAQSASLGRLFRDLGFGQRGLVEGWYSSTLDPVSHSAHRLLADTYATRPRHEVARASELLQSQLMQPLNINNLQPQLAETSLQILEGAGPSSLTFNEFNPLFLRNRVALQPNLLVGSQDTFSNDVVLSGLYGPVSLSLGQFHFQGDGFRSNNDVEDDIYNVFLQAAPTPWLNLQSEYRRRERDRGDLEFKFDPNNFGAGQREKLTQDTVRLGARLSPAPHSDIIASGIYSNRVEKDSTPGIPFVRARGEADGYQGEGQYIFNQPIWNAVLGGGWSEVKNKNLINLELPFPIPAEVIKDNFDITHENIYWYNHIQWPKQMIWTAGLSYDSFQESTDKVKKVSPKFGLQWNATSWARLRAAYFQTVKRALVVQQTIEPTHLAGFNQLFDDTNGTESERFGVALDTVLTSSLYAGVEYSERDLTVPQTLIQGLERLRTKRTEDLFRAYLYWAPHPEWAASAEFEYEQLKRSPSEASVTRGNRFSNVETFTVPLAVRYFHPNGLFARLGGSVVSQEVDVPPGLTLTKDDDTFFLLDAALGFRLPKRRGIITVEGRNLLDKKFFYQDQNLVISGDIISPRFIPERTVFLRVTLALN